VTKLGELESLRKIKRRSWKLEEEDMIFVDFCKTSLK
jgi:hypothetical protein